ncbi:MAG: Crp/Fnr family transcriptional regulator [Bacteroidota bacterium]|nr:Crp/Fnr family transcriptional regulator [Bacteroidota bacterium]
MYQILLKCLLFNGLNSSEIEELLESFTYRKRKFVKNELIATSGNIVKGINILIAGDVRGEMVDFGGKIIKIEDMQTPKVLAPAFLFGKNNVYPVDIIANCNVEILFIHKDSFLKILQLNKAVLMNYLNIISNQSQFLSTKIKFLSFHSIKGKFAHYIINLSNQSNEKEIFLPLSQSKLASLFGVTRPSLSRVIRELNDTKIISAKGKKLKILDETALIEFLS